MILKQYAGELIYLGGPLEKIQPINYSCFNFCRNCNSDLLCLGGDFHYFSVNEKDYINARARNIHFNWKYNHHNGNGYRRTKMARGLARLKAIKELAGYPEEVFLKNNQEFVPNIYFFGSLPKDLEKLNEETYEFEIKEEKITVKEHQLDIEKTRFEMEEA